MYIDILHFPLLKSSRAAGFTLIELLVVIALIGIVSVVAVTLYGNLSANARDAKRIAELEALAKVMEVNKTPGGGAYNPIAANMFAGGTFPGESQTEALDPQGYPYCISINTVTIPPPNLDANLSGVSGWNNTPGLTSCPTTPAGWSKFTGTQPDSSTYSWTICARVENKGTPGAYCRTSTI